ncbi:hypothetical protein [Streptomyces sp. NPDC058758]|uniref:hypothetical protein n=1 Tax=Streptomyces sp. NPDC058758 TaxID=3346627 RepID=UPI0036925C0A
MTNKRRTKPGQFGDTGGIEFLEAGSRNAQPAPAPRGACAATFDRPHLAERDARMKAPCTRPHGHVGAHQNERGVTWGGTLTTRATTTTTTKRSTPMTREQLNKRMKELEARYIKPAKRSTMSAPALPTGALARAEHVVSLALKAPYGGFLPSQIARGLRDLESVGSDLLSLAERTWPGNRYCSYSRQRSELHRWVGDLRAAFAPGATTRTFTQQNLTDMVAAVRGILEPLQTAARLRALDVARLNSAAREAENPTPPPARHPWDTGTAA